jgi:hypothetical protein
MAHVSLWYGQALTSQAPCRAPRGTGAPSSRSEGVTCCFSPKALRLRCLAVWIRRRARETAWPEYGWKMRYAARALEQEAQEVERKDFYAALFGSPRSIISLPGSDGAQEQPLVEPQVLHFMQVPLRTKVKLPQDPQESPSKPLSRASLARFVRMSRVVSREDSAISMEATAAPMGLSL